MEARRPTGGSLARLVLSVCAALVGGCDFRFTFPFFVRDAGVVDGLPPDGDAAVHDASDGADGGDVNDLGCDARCGGRCVDTQTDPENCGACGTRCAGGDASAPCEAGVCGALVCAAGWADCDGNRNNGCEADLTRGTTADGGVVHCGACGITCMAGAHQIATCDGGACSPNCVESYADCDGNPNNGCEVDLRTSVEHCGECRAPCPVEDGGVSLAICREGRCENMTCPTDLRNCDRNSTNACEENILTSRDHCGGCGMSCSSRYDGGIEGLSCRNGVLCCQPGIGRTAPCALDLPCCGALDVARSAVCGDGGTCCKPAGQATTSSSDCCSRAAIGGVCQ